MPDLSLKAVLYMAGSLNRETKAWQDLVESAAEVAYPLHSSEIHQPVQEAIAPLRASKDHETWALGDDIDNASSDAALNAFCRGAVLGFALAREWPADIEGLEGWLAKAVERAKR